MTWMILCSSVVGTLTSTGLLGERWWMNPRDLPAMGECWETESAGSSGEGMGVAEAEMAKMADMTRNFILIGFLKKIA